MDGYATCGADLMPGAWLAVTGRTAGDEMPGRPGARAVHRILTGAPVPDSADAGIVQESFGRQGGLLRIGKAPSPEPVCGGAASTYASDRG